MTVSPGCARAESFRVLLAAAAATTVWFGSHPRPPRQRETFFLRPIDAVITPFFFKSTFLPLGRPARGLMNPLGDLSRQKLRIEGHDYTGGLCVLAG